MEISNKFVVMIFLMLLTLTGCNSSDNSTSEVNEEELQIKLGDRSYLMVLPTEYDDSRAYPLLMAFHQSGGTAETMSRLARFDQLSSDFIVVYPQAKVEEWNEGCGCNKPERLGIDDIAFVDAIIDEIRLRHAIDPERIFATGYSQGGLFVQNLACKRSQVFRAVAIVSAPMSVQLAETCRPTHPISVMMIHAEDDPVLPFEGLIHANFGLISSLESAQFWSAHNDLQLEQSWQQLPENIRVRSSDGTDYKVIIYSPKTGGHAWSFAGLNSLLLVPYSDIVTPVKTVI